MVIHKSLTYLISLLKVHVFIVYKIVKCEKRLKEKEIL